MATVYAPNPRHDGTTASVRFRDGKAEVTDAYLLDWFRRHGYTVEGEGGVGESGPEIITSESEQTEEPQRPPESGPGSGHQAWVDYAVAQGFDREHAESMDRDDLIEALSAGNS